jgi:hypothetical protein
VCIHPVAAAGAAAAIAFAAVGLARSAVSTSHIIMVNTRFKGSVNGVERKKEA